MVPEELNYSLNVAITSGVGVNLFIAIEITSVLRIGGLLNVYFLKGIMAVVYCLPDH